VIGGVAGGLAEYTGVDALLWRVGFVALAITGGFGVLAYILLWLLMPAGPPSPYDPAAAVDPAGRAPRRTRGPRSPVPGVTLAALLIVLGVLTLLNTVGGRDLGPRAFLGSALLVVGLGLVAAAFSTGRTGRGLLIPMGILLSIGLLGSSTVDWRDVHGVGDQRYAPRTASDVDARYHGGVGDLTIDLSNLRDLGDLRRPITTLVDAGVGDVEVLVPREADVRVTVDSGIGNVDLFDEGRSGGLFPGDGGESWSDDGEPEIVLTIDAGIGDVEVSRA
jgi:phage shock protein PspC (stress-responsive transcriptional regulator)